MKKLFLLSILFFAGSVFIKADEMSDGDFLSLLDKVKDPFMVDLPQAPVTLEPPVKHIQAPPVKTVAPPSPKTTVKPVVVPQEVVLPGDLKLEGVIAGEDIRQVIISGEVVDLQGTIEGARVVSITKDGVELLFKGKKFFLKAD